MDGVDEAVLDASYLELRSLVVDGKKSDYELKPRHPVLGNALHVPLHRTLKRGETVKLAIDYSTTAQCTSLGWLEAHQTPSKTLPFLYSQSQAIHSRSLFPCMDTPAVKISYSGVVRSSLPGVTVLLSARRVSPPTDFVPTGEETEAIAWRFDQPVLVPCVGRYFVSPERADATSSPSAPATSSSPRRASGRASGRTRSSSTPACTSSRRTMSASSSRPSGSWTRRTTGSRGMVSFCRPAFLTEGWCDHARVALLTSQENPCARSDGRAR